MRQGATSQDCALEQNCCHGDFGGRLYLLLESVSDQHGPLLIILTFRFVTTTTWDLERSEERQMIWNF